MPVLLRALPRSWIYRRHPHSTGILTHQNLPIRPSQFHASASLRIDSTDEDHYATLGVKHDAPSAEIKKQYISLSKRHHPDHNPEDRSGSSARFMKIAEAYAILGSPSKREHYDLSRPSASSSYGAARAAYPQGSHSSASASAGPFGARPASGLSRRRTHFRGPPPSFYRSGGWGAQAAKRRQGAEAAAAAAAGAASAAGADGPGADTGTGAGAAQAGWADNDVPHWDREAHFRTQEQQQRRRKRRLAMRDDMTFMGGGSLWLNFLFVSGILALGIAVPGFFGSYRSRGPDQDRRAKDVTDG